MNIETENPTQMEKDFLQSPQWLKFQQAFGRQTHFLQKEDFEVGLIEHRLPLVGKYLYAPRGPIAKTQNAKRKTQNFLEELINLAKKENAGWIRIEPASKELLQELEKAIESKIVKAPYDVQPKEVFVLDLSKSEEELLAAMKAKTRYNINLAKKKEVSVRSANAECVEAFLRLTGEMAKRQGIAAHPESYYRKMLEVFPAEMLKLYCAEFGGEIIAANLVLIHGGTATYLHGASGDRYRNVMAPYLLQWQAIMDAKKAGCTRYDFGGVQTQEVEHKAHSDLSGVSNFKLGFAPNTKTIVFPGTFDIIVNPRAYALYRGLQKAKMIVRKFRR